MPQRNLLLLSAIGRDPSSLLCATPPFDTFFLPAFSWHPPEDSPDPAFVGTSEPYHSHSLQSVVTPVMLTLRSSCISSNLGTSAMLVATAWFSSLTSISRTLLVFAGVLLLVRVVMKRLKRAPLPPGPWGLPVLGYLPFMKEDYHLLLTELSKEYGPVFQIFLGSKRVVVVSDPTLVREAFKQPVFSGRPDTELTKLLQGLGIINSDGARWKEQRSFLHSVLRDFGAKNTGQRQSALEKNIKSQVCGFLDSLRQTSCNAIQIRVPLARAISNVVGSVLMSVTFDPNDKGFARLLHLIEDGFRLLTLAVPVNFVPVLRFLPKVNRAYRQIQNNKQETTEYFAKVAGNHKKSLNRENVRDFVDAFYLQQQKATDANKKTYFSEEQLLQVMGDIFSAGLETVTSLLEWGILYLIYYPEVQKKIQEEIDRVVGKDREPELQDLPHMPYTEATMLEMLRRANVIALGNAHATLEDTELGGYFIPKDSHVLPNLWAIHMDPTLWDDPDAFKPERFLVNNQIVKPSHFMPFSVGRRMCVGDTLTRMEVFLFLTNILQKFDLQVPEGESPPQLRGEANVSLKPRPFKLCAVPRQQDSQETVCSTSLDLIAAQCATA